MDVMGYDSHALYTLGHKYGGEEKPQVNKYRKTKHFQGRGNYGRKRKPMVWTRDIKGFYKCGKEHQMNYYHSREDVTESISKLKSINPTETLSKKGNANIQDISGDDDYEEDQSYIEARDDSGQYDDDIYGAEQIGFTAEVDLALYEAELSVAVLYFRT